MLSPSWEDTHYPLCGFGGKEVPSVQGLGWFQSSKPQSMLKSHVYRCHWVPGVIVSQDLPCSFLNSNFRLLSIMTLLKTLLWFLSTAFNLALYPPDLSRIMRKCLWGQTDAEFQSHFSAFGLLSPVGKRKSLSAFLTLSIIPLPEFSANALRRKVEQVTGVKMDSPLLISSFLWDLLSVGSVSSRFFSPYFFFFPFWT